MKDVAVAARTYVAATIVSIRVVRQNAMKHQWDSECAI